MTRAFFSHHPSQQRSISLGSSTPIPGTLTRHVAEAQLEPLTQRFQLTRERPSPPTLCTLSPSLHWQTPQRPICRQLTQKHLDRLRAVGLQEALYNKANWATVS